MNPGYREEENVFVFVVVINVEQTNKVLLKSSIRG